MDEMLSLFYYLLFPVRAFKNGNLCSGGGGGGVVELGNPARRGV